MCPTNWSLAFVSISTALSSSNSPTTSPWRTCAVASTSHLASRPPASAKAWCAPCPRRSDSLTKAWEVPNDCNDSRCEARRSPSNHGDPCWTPCAWRARRSCFGWRLLGRQPHVEGLARESGHVPHPHSPCKPARGARALPPPTRERLDAGESSCALNPGGDGCGYRQRGRQPPCHSHSGCGGDGRAGRQPGDDSYQSTRRRTMTNPRARHDIDGARQGQSHDESCASQPLIHHRRAGIGGRLCSLADPHAARWVAEAGRLVRPCRRRRRSRLVLLVSVVLRSRRPRNARCLGCAPERRDGRTVSLGP